MQIIKKAFRLFVRPYWASEDKAAAWLLLLASLLFSYFVVDATVRINFWITDFYNEMQAKNVDAFAETLKHFLVLVFYLIVMFVGFLIGSRVLIMRWRQWLTEHMSVFWLEKKRYYQAGLVHDTVDNPDQRLSEDVNSFVNLTLNLCNDLFREGLTLITFCAILWHIVPAFEWTWGEQTWIVPGYLFWTALGYATLATLITYWVGRPLIGLDVAQERYEADFRFGLMRIREYREPIALMKGEPFERNLLKHVFSFVIQNYYQRLNYQIRISIVNNLAHNWRIVVPFFFAAPVYFSGLINFGQLMQTYNAFMIVEEALSYFAKHFTLLAQWLATMKRLVGFHEHLMELEGASRIADSDHVSVTDLAATTPEGKRIFEARSFNVSEGARVLVQGPNGAGKSTLFRCLAGIWPYWSGHIERPAHSVFVPQKPYFPMATLDEALAYPKLPAELKDMPRVGAWLTQVGLPQLHEERDRVRDWSKTLSLGEQQKLQFIRLFLHQPAWMFLDEPLSALDAGSRSSLLDHLLQACPKSTLVMISHLSEGQHHWTQVVAFGSLGA